ncbi:hypothetical protein GCM10023090_02430 [Acidovorax lacteus]|uniref:Uncharacterized protein n=1 Tax=Acidovorax lacteus TaxID=1924988 RepID=A0ABP8KX96_9BURK
MTAAEPAGDMETPSEWGADACTTGTDATLSGAAEEGIAEVGDGSATPAAGATAGGGATVTAPTEGGSVAVTPVDTDGCRDTGVVEAAKRCDHELRSPGNHQISPAPKSKAAMSHSGPR